MFRIVVSGDLINTEMEVSEKRVEIELRKLKKHLEIAANTFVKKEMIIGSLNWVRKVPIQIETEIPLKSKINIIKL